MGNFQKNNNLIGSIAYHGQVALTGCVTGELYAWNGTTLTKSVGKNHSKLIDAITVTSQDIFTGGRDAKICVLNPANYAVKATFNCTEGLPGTVSGAVRAISFDSSMNALYVGTFGHEIYKVGFQTGSKRFAQTGTNLIKGHYAPLVQDNNECWGLATNPSKANFVATVSDDSTLRLWDVQRHIELLCVKFDKNIKGDKIPVDPKTKEAAHSTMGRAVDVSPDGS